MIRFAILDEASDPRGLRWGDAEALFALAAQLRVLSSDGSLVFGDVALRIAENESNVTRADTDCAAFVWSIRTSDRARFADQIDAAAASVAPCHHYLDPDGRGCTVIVSKGEYPDSFRV